MKKLLAWHFCRNDRIEQYGDTPQTIEAGYTYDVDPPVELCTWGLHASVKPLDALYYAPGEMVCRVELHGEMVNGRDKVAATKRTVLWMADAAHTLHEFACLCAEDALALLRFPDPRSANAIAVKRAWLRGDATDDELVAAWDAARVAARAAARDAAGAAAWVAAGAAARDAARAAARDAAWDAARDAAWDAQNQRLAEMLEALK